MSKTGTATKAETNAPSQEASVLSLSKSQQKTVDGMTTVSARIRFLDSEGYTRSEITRLILNAKGEKLIYQHVRGVLTAKTPANPST